MIKGKHLEYSLGETSGMKKFFCKKVFQDGYNKDKKVQRIFG